jgi:hypothetical protein
MRTLLHRALLAGREGTGAATVLADDRNPRPPCPSFGAGVPQFLRAALEIVEYRLGPFDFGPLHPDLGLVYFGDEAADPSADLGIILNDKGVYPAAINASRTKIASMLFTAL